jgi:hypothetical protein
MPSITVPFLNLTITPTAASLQPAMVVPTINLTITTFAPSIELDLNSDNYTGDADNFWHGGILGGIPVINNGVDIPQVWNPPTTGTRLIDLPNWPANTTAKVVKPFLNFLIALNITEAGTDKPHMFWWSHSADPGTIPDSWDHTDATKDAGRAELSNVMAGVLQDGEALGNLFIMYKDNATHSLQFVGGTFIWDRDPVFDATGILATRCVNIIPAGKNRPVKHIVATGDDIITHNGHTAESILDEKMRKFLNANLDATNYIRSYMALHKRQDEAWFCFPENNESFPTLAIVWNYADGTLGVRDLDNAAFINSGVISETGGGNTWDDLTVSWDNFTTPWNERQFNPQEVDLLQCSPQKTQFLHLDQTNQFNGVNITSTIERTGLGIIGVDKYNRPTVNMTRRKLATRIWPRMSGGPIDIQIGAQEEIGGTVTWATAKAFTAGTDNYLDFTVSGRLFALRFSSSADVAWSLEGYDINVEDLGEL